MTRKALLVAMLCAVCGTATAEDDQAPWSASTIYDGAKLLITHESPAGLSEDERAQSALAFGWLVGVESTLEATGLEGRSKAAICVSLPPTPHELAQRYVFYIDAHPDVRQNNAASILMEALKAAHPCK